jgi:hypothetical protein
LGDFPGVVEDAPAQRRKKRPPRIRMTPNVFLTGLEPL